jgi:hypothetical protein
MCFNDFLEKDHTKTKTGDQIGGSEWELIKILLEGDGHSKKTNTATKHVSDSTTQVGQDHVAIGLLLVLGTNTQPSEPKHTNTHSGNLHGLLSVLHRLDRWPAPVRPVSAPVRLVATAATQQTFQEASVTPLGPGTKTTPKTQPAMKRNPSQSLAKQLQTRQELTSRTTGQNHTNIAVPRGKPHQRLAPVRPVKSTVQTSHAWAARDEQRLRVNSPKLNPRSPDSLHGFAQDFGNSRSTSWALHSQVMVHQNSLNQEGSKDFRQDHHKP